jgi:hypothetical protein
MNISGWDSLAVGHSYSIDNEIPLVLAAALWSTRKPKAGACIPCLLSSPYVPTFEVDENLFYKGVDKNAVHGARLHKSHSLSEQTFDSHSPGTEDANEEHPPYPFESGDSLLALTKKHNVRQVS